MFGVNQRKGPAEGKKVFFGVEVEDPSPPASTAAFGADEEASTTAVEPLRASRAMVAALGILLGATLSFALWKSGELSTARRAAHAAEARAAAAEARAGATQARVTALESELTAQAAKLKAAEAERATLSQKLEEKAKVRVRPVARSKRGKGHRARYSVR